MISLILTLFISLLSLGSPIYRLGEYKESGISTISNESLNSSKPISNAYSDKYGYTYIGLSEFGDYTFYRAFINNIKNYDYVGNSGVPVDNYLNGTPATVTGLTLELGTLAGASFTRIRDYTTVAFYHEYSSSTATRTTITFSGASGSGATPYVVRGYFQFNDTDYRYCINNIREVIQQTGQPFSETNLCFRFFTNFNLDIFPALTDTDYQEGYNTGYNDGQSVGYQDGYSVGYSDGASVDSTASTIFTGILDVALIPVNVFLTIFNFEVFGINISGIVSGLLTLSVVIIIFRFLFGGNKDD